MSLCRGPCLRAASTGHRRGRSHPARDRGDRVPAAAAGSNRARWRRTPARSGADLCGRKGHGSWSLPYPRSTWFGPVSPPSFFGTDADRVHHRLCPVDLTDNTETVGETVDADEMPKQALLTKYVNQTSSKCAGPSRHLPLASFRLVTVLRGRSAACAHVDIAPARIFRARGMKFKNFILFCACPSPRPDAVQADDRQGRQSRADCFREGL